LTRFFKQAAAAIALGALALSVPLGAQPAQAQDDAQEQEVVKAAHGAWDVVCSSTNTDQCLMRQVGTTADGKKVLIVRIRKLDGVKTQDGKAVPGAIQISTPLGTILRAGVQVKIDSGEPRTGAFEFCIPSGCVVRDAMSEPFLANLKAGNAAKMSFAMLQQGEVSVDISLKGFTKAFNAL